MRNLVVWYLPQAALFGAVATLLAGCQFENKETAFSHCRQLWIERYNPKIGLNFAPQPVEFEYVRACMGAKGFKVAANNECWGNTVLSRTSCYERRMPWE